MTIIAFILILALLVLVHELGHFIAAKRSGIFVEEFGFGYPPRLFGIKIGETMYSLNIIPLGGFVKLYGEEQNELTEARRHRPPQRNAFVNKKPWQKVIVLVAGVAGNFLLGWFLISVLFTRGIPTLTDQIIVEQIQSRSPAAMAGLREKDIIVEAQVNGKTYALKNADALTNLARQNAGRHLILKIKRQKHLIAADIVPRAHPPAGQGAMGIIITSFIEKRYPWYQAPLYGLKEAYDITVKIIGELFKTGLSLVTLKKTQIDVAGPIGIAQFTGQAIRFGFNAVLEFIAILSLNLAVLNILPFPALDGGRLALVVYEWVARRKVNRTFEKYLNVAGFAVLISLAILISIHDVIKLINK